MRHNVASTVLICAALFTSPAALAQFSQQGPKLQASDTVGQAFQGRVAVSADGNTAVVGGSYDNRGDGAVWIWVRNGGAWRGQGSKLVGSGAVGEAGQGSSVAISADGNTVLVGGSKDNPSPNGKGSVGAAWVWTRSQGVWTQQGNKLTGSGAAGFASQGTSVSLSADGNTAIVGGPSDDQPSNTAANASGAAWIWTRSNGAWTQQGNKLVGLGAAGGAFQGQSVALSADGNTAIVGGPYDDTYRGAAWVWTRSGTVWSQQGLNLVASGTQPGTTIFAGISVALSADGNTAIIGGSSDNNFLGAAWIWTRTAGVWQQDSKLVSAQAGVAEEGNSVSLSADGNTALIGGPLFGKTGAAWVWAKNNGTWSEQATVLIASDGTAPSHQGQSVSLSADGKTAFIGGPYDRNDPDFEIAAGAAWAWTRNGSTWSQQGSKLVGSGAQGSIEQGFSSSLSADGSTAIVGGALDNSFDGAAWIWTRSGGVWAQQGSKLVGTGAVGTATQGGSVAISGDGNTAIVGGPGDSNQVGAAWIWTRSGNVWTQGNKLTGTGAMGTSRQGWSVALSADGNTAIVGGPGSPDLSSVVPEFPPDISSGGAAWVWRKSHGVWFQQGPPLIAPTTSPVRLGLSVALSADGNTAIVGGLSVAWVWTDVGGVWIRQSQVLPGSGETSVALSADGNTAIIGRPAFGSGDAVVWTRNAAVWTQQGPSLTVSGAVTNAYQGTSVALSADGNIAVIGGPGDLGGGSAWVWKRSGGVWTEGTRLAAESAGDAAQGSSVAISADGSTVFVGGPGEEQGLGAVWVFASGAGGNQIPRQRSVRH